MIHHEPWHRHSSLEGDWKDALATWQRDGSDASLREVLTLYSRNPSLQREQQIHDILSYLAISTLQHEFPYAHVRPNSFSATQGYRVVSHNVEFHYSDPTMSLPFITIKLHPEWGMKDFADVSEAVPPRYKVFYIYQGGSTISLGPYAEKVSDSTPTLPEIVSKLDKWFAEVRRDRE